MEKSFTPSGLKLLGMSQPRAVARGYEKYSSFGAKMPEKTFVQ